MDLFGRRVIYTDDDVLDAEKVLAVLQKALETHRTNRAEIQYLLDYYKGKQPILNRTKEYHDDICNKIVENRANEIVSFKVGYLIGEPVQYVSHGSADDEEKESIAKSINQINRFVFAEDKAAKDKELAEWFTICGTAYRMVLPEPNDENAPFHIFTLDPRSAFVVYHSGLGNKPVMGVRYVIRQDNSTVYSVYTADHYYEIVGNDSGTSFQITKDEGHIFGGVPIIEYPANPSRLGAFEIVIPLLDSLNTIASNRVDGLEQFIQSLLVLTGVDIKDSDFKKVKDLGGLALPQGATAQYLTQELNQTQTQALVDNTYQTILVVCGMPNRNGGSSTSDTGQAVIMRDGWSDAEARAKYTEGMFKLSEKLFLRLALEFARTYTDCELKVSDVEIRFTRRNYENIQVKAQVLTQLLSSDRVHPRLAFEHCGLFVDPDLAYSISAEYMKTHKEDAEADLDDYAKRQTSVAQSAAHE